MAGFGEIGLLSTVSGGVNCLSYRRAVWLYLKKKNNLSYTHLVPAIQLPRIYLLDICAKVHKDVCARMFIKI